jgi:arabinogalactan endo-1,4-beta-galactosidase
MILETAYPWTLSYADNYRNILGADYLIEGYEASVEGQRQFMIDLVKEVLDGVEAVYFIGSQLGSHQI